MSFPQFRIRLLCIAALLLCLVVADGTARPRPEPTDDPCVVVGDLDFGSLTLGQSKEKTLRISNDGGGTVVFNNPSGGSLIEWLTTRFTIAPSELAKLTDARLGRGQYVDVTVLFVATEAGVFRDTARIWASVRKCRDVSFWVARVIVPGAQITGYDWERQWAVQGPCASADDPRGTKNPSREYAAEVYAFNTGDASFDVDRVELQGPDAGFFELDQSDALKAIRHGDRIQPLDPTTGMPKYAQRVLFRPGPQERAYSCDIVLVSIDGQVARNTLRGSGVESHITAPPVVDFGRSLSGSTPVRRTASFGAAGSRPVSITGLTIVPANAASAGRFTIINAQDIVGRTFGFGATVDVLIEYAPTGGASEHRAELVVTGDFSPCDDSTVTLIGGVSTLSVRAQGLSFGSLLTCFERESAVSVENDGSDTVVVVGMGEVGDIAGVFNPKDPIVPDTLAPGERMDVPVTFAPNTVGDFSAMYEFELRDITMVTPVLFNGGPVVAVVTGTGEKVQGRAHIDRDYRGLPGTRFTVDVILDKALDGARVDQLDFSLRYANGVMKHDIDINSLSSLVAGTILGGWAVELTPAPTVDPMDKRQSVIFLRLAAPAGGDLAGTGVVLKIPFILLSGDTTSSELAFSLTPRTRLACAEIVDSAGFVRLDSIVVGGLDDVVVTQDVETRDLLVGFRRSVDGVTRIEIFNAGGERVRFVTDEYVQPGPHVVRIGTGGLGLGPYFLSLINGAQTRVEKLMIVP